MVQQRFYFQRQTKQVDEPGSVFLVVCAAVVAKGGYGLVIQGVRGSDSGVHHIALVQLQLHIAGYGFLSLVDKCVQCLTQGREPQAVVYQLAVFLRHQLLVVGSVPIQGDHFQHLMGFVQNGAAGSLIYTAALHAYQTVLNNIQQTDAVLAAQLVELFHQGQGAHLYAVNGGGLALLKVNGDVSGFVRCVLRGNAQLQKTIFQVLRLVGRVLQIQTLVAQVPYIFILRVVRLPIDLQRNVVRLCILDLFFTALNAPLTPGGDDLHFRCQRL